MSKKEGVFKVRIKLKMIWIKVKRSHPQLWTRKHKKKLKNKNRR